MFTMVNCRWVFSNHICINFYRILDLNEWFFNWVKKSNSNLNPIRYFNELSNMTCYYPLSMTNYFESNIDKNVKSLTKQFKPDKLKYIIITNTYM